MDLNSDARNRRLRSSMLVINGGGGKQGEAEGDSVGQLRALSNRDPNAAFAADLLQSSTAQAETATQVSNLDHTIIQGKMIDAVLETAINTDLPGTLRAVVSRDVYAEAGRDVMIPKGSRLIGRYNTGIARGQERIFIIWTRMIRPDGVDIALNSEATDPLGRAGVAGYVDNKYFETFTTALLTSLIAVGAGIIADSNIDQDIATTVNTDGSTTQTGGAGASAVSNTFNSLGNISRSIVQQSLDARPTITVDQGTRINVFVNHDLVFPPSFGNRTFIQ